MKITQLKRAKTKKDRELDALADAILRYFEWRHNQAELKEQRKIKAMITRLRNRRLRQNLE